MVSFQDLSPLAFSRNLPDKAGNPITVEMLSISFVRHATRLISWGHNLARRGMNWPKPIHAPVYELA